MRIFQPTITGSSNQSGSAIISGSLNVLSGITGSLFGTASNAVSASFAPSVATFPYTGSAIISGSLTVTGSYNLLGNVYHTGSVYHSGSKILNGIFVQTGSLLISGSTTQIGTNTLLGSTTLSGSIIISGSTTSPPTPTIKVYGDMETNGVIKFMPVVKNLDASISASYIFVSGSTNDLYFSQNGSGYANTTRLRWLEGNLYTGLLSGGVLSSTPGSTTFNLTSGSAIIVTLNASTGSTDPYPTIQYIKWNNYTNQPITNSGSARITYVGIDNNGAIIQQTIPWGSTDITQWDTQVEIGVVLHLSGSVSTGVYNAPQVAYGVAQRTDDFVRAFGPLKISGHTLQPSGSSLGLTKTSGTSYNNGSNYITNPNHPSTVSDPAINTSKIYRYYVSGSTPIINTGVAAAGYTVIDPTLYNNNGTLAAVAGGQYSIQRVFWIPNSPTNAFLVYYGNAVYNSSDTAVTAIQTEPFTEAPNTAQNAILLGYIIVKSNESDLRNSVFVQGGLFRSVNGIGNSNTTPVSNTLAGLSDVSVGSRTSGDLLYYNGSQWVNSKSLTGNYTITGSFATNDGITAVTVTATSFTGSLNGNATTATSASYASTASYVLNAISSSYASSASYYGGNVTSASYASTASYATQALSASWAPAGSSTPSLTSTYVGFGDGSNLLTGNSNFVVNTTTGYASAPLVINVGGVPSGGYGIFNHFQMPYQITAFKSTTSGNPSEVQIYNNANALQFGVEGSSANSRMNGTLAYNMYFGCYYNYGLTFHTNNQAAGAISAAGNWFFGGNTTASSKVHIKGSGTTSGTTSFLVQNSTPTDLFKITDDGAISTYGPMGIGTSAPNSSNYKLTVNSGIDIADNTTAILRIGAHLAGSGYPQAVIQLGASATRFDFEKYGGGVLFSVNNSGDATVSGTLTVTKTADLSGGAVLPTSAPTSPVAGSTYVTFSGGTGTLHVYDGAAWLTTSLNP